MPPLGDYMGPWADKHVRPDGWTGKPVPISIGRHDCVSRVIQGEGLPIREDDHGLFRLACHRQTSIFYRNWPGKWVLSGQGQTRGRLDYDSERLEEQAERGETLERVAFPDACPRFTVVSTEESVLFLEILDHTSHQPRSQLRGLLPQTVGQQPLANESIPREMNGLAG